MTASARRLFLSPLFSGTLLVLGITSQGCAEVDDDPSEGPTSDSETALVGAHVYTRPSKPTKSYPAPSTNTIWVATNGNDTSGNGSSTAPYRTVAKAVAVANGKPAGATWTVVIRAGTYREGGIVITRSNVTIQRNGSDAVSIWGTVTQGGFSGSGPYTATVDGFDTAPLKVNCADDHLDKGNRHHGAEQAFSVIRAGVPLVRVAAGSNVGAGQYSFDNATNRLTIRDSPTEIEVVQKLWAFQTRASNVRIAGLDIEGYGTCTVDYRKVVGGIEYYSSAVQFLKDAASESGNVLEGSTIANNASAGMNVANAKNVTLRDNVFVNNGWNGAKGSASDGLAIVSNVFGYNNFRRWANAVEAGMKVSFIKDGIVWGNVFEHNAANGYWCDQGCGSTNLSKNFYVIAQNVFRNNDGKGLFYEVSHHGMIASNVSHDNGSAGIAAYGARATQIWNNTLVDNNVLTAGYLANLSIVDDVRCAQGDILPGGKSCTSGTPGVEPLPRNQYDHCAPASDGPLANTCNSESIVVVNNIISGSAGSRPLVNVSIPAKTYNGALTVTRSEYQSFFRPASNAPSGLIEWQKDASGNPIAYGTLDQFRAAIGGREVNSLERVAAGAHPFFVDYARKNFTQKSSNGDVWGRGATLPSEVLKAIYWPNAAPAQPSKRIGAIAWASGGGGTTPPPTEPPPATCDLAAPVYHVSNPSTGAQLFTLSASEATSARTTYGYSTDGGVAFDAGAATSSARVPVYRLRNPSTQDRLYTISASEKASAAASYGYTSDEGIAFYAASASAPCLVAVHRLRSGSIHTYAATSSEISALLAQGWVDEGTVFWGGAP